MYWRLWQWHSHLPWRAVENQALQWNHRVFDSRQCQDECDFQPGVVKAVPKRVCCRFDSLHRLPLQC